ncbi:MAG: phosphate signaling complex protein PhoU [Bacillota bacterium]
MTLRMKYDRELEAMLSKLVKMARATEDAIEDTIVGLIAGDKEKLKEVYNNDKEIDNMEREIERNCFKLLLMEQPVATDFREVSAALKMITDFERIADQASDIAHLGWKVNLDSCKSVVSTIKAMADSAKSMLHEGVSAYINKDVELAKSLSDKDDEVDSMFKEVKDKIVAGIKDSSVDPEEAILIMMIAKYLERIADHAVNVGEWVEYAVTGQHKAHKDLVY